MTLREVQTIDFIVAYQARNGGASPSLAQIAAHLGLKSRTGAHHIVDGLIADGRLRRKRGRHREIVVIAPDVPRLLRDFSTAELAAELEHRHAAPDHKLALAA